MVVRLQKDQFTAGDMIIAVRSRRKARADPRFYGENVGKLQVKNKKEEVSTPITDTVSVKSEIIKDSDDYFNPVLLEDVKTQKEDNLHDRARKLLTEIEEDMKRINMKQESLKRNL
jgi:hypothetical protein